MDNCTRYSNGTIGFPVTFVLISNLATDIDDTNILQVGKLATNLLLLSEWLVWIKFKEYRHHQKVDSYQIIVSLYKWLHIVCVQSFVGSI